MEVIKRMKMSEIGKETKVEGTSEIQIVKARTSFLGLVRKMCLDCRECEDQPVWTVKIRKSRNDKDLWGLECAKKNLRVIS